MEFMSAFGQLSSCDDLCVSLLVHPILGKPLSVGHVPTMGTSDVCLFLVHLRI